MNPQCSAIAHSPRMTEMKQEEHMKLWWGYGATGTLIYCSLECKLVQYTFEKLKVNIHIPYNPAFPILGLPLKNVFTKRHIRLFTAASFIVTKTWKQPKCPSRVERINKSWYIHSSKYYSTIKKNELLPTTRWISILKKFKFFVRIQTLKVYCIISLKWSSRTGKL